MFYSLNFSITIYRGQIKHKVQVEACREVRMVFDALKAAYANQTPLNRTINIVSYPF